MRVLHLPGLQLAHLALISTFYVVTHTSPAKAPEKKVGDHVPEKQTIVDKVGLTLVKFCSVFDPLVACAVGYYVYTRPNLPRSFPYKRLALIFSVSSYLGSFLRLWCYKELGQLFTFELGVKKEGRVVKTGPYRFTRHPSYIGGALSSTGYHGYLVLWIRYLIDLGVIPWYSHAATGLYAIYLGILPFFIYSRVQVEEKMLREVYGEEYGEYANQTIL